VDIFDIRRRNTRQLAQRAGGITRLAQRIERDPALVSRYIGKTPTRNIGPRMARVIERAHQLPHGWLDTLDADRSAHSLTDAYLDASPATQQFIQRLLTLEAAHPLDPQLLDTLQRVLEHARPGQAPKNR
jgi:hypothetical protein